MRRLFVTWLTAATLTLGASATVFAQDEPAAAAETAEASPKQIKEFKAARLESLRYRHLWIAYGAVWLIVFAFVFRTWRTGNKTGAELEDLKRRLADLEKQDG